MQSHKNYINYNNYKKYNKNIRITKMEKEHISAVAKLEAEVFAVPWSQQAFSDAFRMEHAFFYVAAADNDVVGYCGATVAADEGEITNIAVAPDCRRQNIAKQLLQDTMAGAYEKGARRIFLEVRSRNEPAIQLYQNAGFQTVGIRKKYYRDPQDDALMMMYQYADII